MKIEIKNLTKIYPRGKKKALSAVNLEIDRGIFGLIGRNGAGKTTLMRIVATIMEATEGEIFFDGKELKNKFVFATADEAFDYAVNALKEMLAEIGHPVVDGRA